MSVDDGFDELLGDARRGIERIASAPPAPDFGDVIARLAEERPELAADLDDASADVVHLQRGDARQEAALDTWVADARVGIQAQIDEHRMRPMPQLRRPSSGPALGRLTTWGLLALAAAVVLLAVSLRASVLTRAAEDTGEQSLHVETPAAGSGGFVEQAVPSASTEDARPRPRAPEQSVQAMPPASPPAPKSSASRGEALQTLASEAEALWKAGDLAGARRLYERIVARGGRTRHAELAYADLFSLTHQQGDEVARQRLLRDYVRRFPAGRFADDARAGLCRSATADARTDCWQAYLGRAGGAYRHEAERALGDPPK